MFVLQIERVTATYELARAFVRREPLWPAPRPICAECDAPARFAAAGRALCFECLELRGFLRARAARRMRGAACGLDR